MRRFRPPKIRSSTASSSTSTGRRRRSPVFFRYDYYGYPKDYLAQYQKSIAAVTKADILRVAKQYLDPSKFVITTIGNIDVFKLQLTE